MTLGRGFLGCVFSGLVLLTAAQAERRRDPLTQLEVDQLRDTAQEPDLRLKLYVKFARLRLEAVDKARSDAKDRAQETHDRLEDFLDVYDELNDNIDTFADRRNDIRKVLKNIIEADTEFQARIRALKDSATASKEDMKDYEFLLSNALDTLETSAQDHRQLLGEQEEAAKHKQLIKPESASANKR
jgi:predicted  nucleic acid-binding Zn-ribbon protein